MLKPEEIKYRCCFKFHTKHSMVAKKGVKFFLKKTPHVMLQENPYSCISSNYRKGLFLTAFFTDRESGVSARNDYVNHNN